MKVALPVWQGRVSPVFDVARTLVLVDVADGVEMARRSVELSAENPQARAGEVSGLGVDVLICGAISRPLEMALQGAGVRVIPQTCGDAEEVLSAFADGGFGEDVFLMPGCCGRRRRMQGRGGRGPGPGRARRRGKRGGGHATR